MMLIIHLHLVPRLKMSGAVPVLLLYVFMVCTGTASCIVTKHNLSHKKKK